nr:hypothetical protein [Tanacetum cinerariifolium]
MTWHATGKYTEPGKMQHPVDGRTHHHHHYSSTCRVHIQAEPSPQPTEDHITRHVFDLSYKSWVHHGEPALPQPPPVIDNTRQPQMSDMIALLNDLSYIPPNNEHNEPTQKDIGETSNEPTQATRNEFEELAVPRL